jgi:acyl-CoA thioester hydrolase
MKHQLIYHQTVAEADLDHNNHVNNMVYLRWAHQASDRHWNEKSTAIQRDSLHWVLGRQEIDYLRELKLDDNIKIVTFISQIERQKCFRTVQFYKMPENILCANCILVWVALDATTKKPVRVNQAIKDQFIDSDE